MTGKVIDLIPGFALGALSDDEAQRVRSALADSADCRRELAEFQEVVALLAVAGPRIPPASLRQRLLDRIAAD